MRLHEITPENEVIVKLTNITTDFDKSYTNLIDLLDKLKNYKFLSAQMAIGVKQIVTPLLDQFEIDVNSFIDCKLFDIDVDHDLASKFEKAKQQLEHIKKLRLDLDI